MATNLEKGIAGLVVACLILFGIRYGVDHVKKANARLAAAASNEQAEVLGEVPQGEPAPADQQPTHSSESFGPGLFAPIEDIRGLDATSRVEQLQLREKPLSTQSGDVYGWTNRVDMMTGKTNRVWAKIQAGTDMPTQSPNATSE